ncbi:MAG: hypothetical protein CMF51_04005 [Legionellales bacterium]|nr:hypothetical protein [Legionellales bacterium]|tara:strand:- start:1191 stop:1550 length:360 start_codon:yes stop_codon:yes gene_type:complete
MYKYLSILLVSIVLFGCAHPTVVPVEMPGDRDLNCNELKVAYENTQQLQKKAEQSGGFTGGNVARAVLFWPALAGTYLNAQEAEHAAQHRALHLTHLMNLKHCHIETHSTHKKHSPKTH